MSLFRRVLISEMSQASSIVVKFQSFISRKVIKMYIRVWANMKYSMDKYNIVMEISKREGRAWNSVLSVKVGVVVWLLSNRYICRIRGKVRKRKSRILGIR